jgi:hypothetical protein
MTRGGQRGPGGGTAQETEVIWQRIVRVGAALVGTIVDGFPAPVTGIAEAVDLITVLRRFCEGANDS